MSRGWFGDGYRHGLSARGIKSGRTPKTTALPEEVLIWKKKKKKEWTEKEKKESKSKFDVQREEIRKGIVK